MDEEKKNIPVVTVALIAINVIVWVALEMGGSTYDTGYMVKYGAMYTPNILEGRQWWRLLTCTFLHFGATHLVNNMLMLALMGMRLENVLGRMVFALLYLLSGICGSGLSYYMALRERCMIVSAGASGAVFGVLGGMIAAAILNHGRVEGLTVKGLLVMLALNLYNGFTTVGVDNWGHIGGFLGGFLISFIFCLVGKYRKD